MGALFLLWSVQDPPAVRGVRAGWAGLPGVPNVVFAATNGWHDMWGTEVARGYQIVQTWASRAELVVDCGKKEHRLREIASALGECNVVIVHIKRICTNLLAEFPAAVHVQDVLDGGEIRKGTHGMSAAFGLGELLRRPRTW